MLPEKFEKLCNEFMEEESRLMDWKAGEYSDGEDRLQNFREIANLMDCKKSEVALMYLLKHIQSIKNAVKEDKVNWYWQNIQGEGTKQRIADTRNYLLLLAACLEEESEKWQGVNDKEYSETYEEKMRRFAERINKPGGR